MTVRRYILAGATGLACGLIWGSGLTLAPGWVDALPPARQDIVEPAIELVAFTVALVCALAFEWWALRAHLLFGVVFLACWLAIVVPGDVQWEGGPYAWELLPWCGDALLGAAVVTLGWGLGRLLRGGVARLRKLGRDHLIR